MLRALPVSVGIVFVANFSVSMSKLKKGGVGTPVCNFLCITLALRLYAFQRFQFMIFF